MREVFEDRLFALGRWNVLLSPVRPDDPIADLGGGLSDDRPVSGANQLFVRSNVGANRQNPSSVWVPLGEPFHSGLRSNPAR